MTFANTSYFCLFFDYCSNLLEELQPTRRFLAEVKRRKLQYFGHTERADNSCTHVLHGNIIGNRCLWRPRRRWTDDIKQWTGASVAECVQCARDTWPKQI